MVDQFDRAQELDAHYRNQAIAQQRMAVKEKGESRMHCIDCGERIPDGRREAAPSCQRCLECAEKVEQDQRRIG